MEEEIDVQELERLAADADATHLIDIEAIDRRVHQEEPYCPYGRIVILGAIRENLLKAYKGLTQEEVVREFESPEKIVNPGRIALLNLGYMIDVPGEFRAAVEKKGNEVVGGGFIGVENLKIDDARRWHALPMKVYFEYSDKNRAVSWRYRHIEHVFGAFQMDEGRKILVPHAVWTTSGDAEDAAIVGSSINYHADIPK
ncbi:hypothetical protein GF371_00850 [Candidatus Woesearchaeota archaeon]|nr:hypothetical protein [Candidatus Woesearchaeota archaeon]